MHLMGHVPKQLWVVLHAMRVAIHVLVRDELSDWGEIGMHGMLQVYYEQLLTLGYTIMVWRYNLGNYCFDEFWSQHDTYGYRHLWIYDAYMYIFDAGYDALDFADTHEFMVHELGMLLFLLAKILWLLDICMETAENFVDDPFGLRWMENPWGVLNGVIDSILGEDSSDGLTSSDDEGES